MLRPFAISTAFFFMMSIAYTRDMIEVFHVEIIELSHTPHCFEGVRIMFVNRPWAIHVL